jgi:hypothetical protein
MKTPGASTSTQGRWPPLPLAAWSDTKDTLHLWTQVVGKVRLALAPPQNHWWHTPLYVCARGLTTSAIPSGDRMIELRFDLVRHNLEVEGSDGVHRAMPLYARTVRSFHEELLDLLRALDVDVRVWRMPVEIPDPIPFDEDEVHRAYDPAAAHRFFQALAGADAALTRFARGFVGKQSPVHFFWGSFDLAYTRFSGRRAPDRPDADRITREAYSHEVLSFGFWPGGVAANGVAVEEPVFYAYAAPEPPGFREAAVAPGAARYDARLSEFLLPYDAVRQSGDPAAGVLAFCASVYEAGAVLGRWDRAALESEPAAGGHGKEGLGPGPPA